MSISNWVDQTLIGEAEDERQTYKVTVRLEPAQYAELRDVARVLDLSATKAATGMLVEAISEARGHDTICRYLQAEAEAEATRAEEERYADEI